MSKNAEGWIRHRGGKCPVDDGVMVEVRLRDGTLWVGDGAEKASYWTWERLDNFSDIMAYRLHKPAEQDIIKELDDAISIASDGNQSAMAKAIHERAAEFGLANLIHNSKAVEGPIQWRDRITTIDFDIKDLTTERAELVQKLASEGFELIGRIVEPMEDMSDWRNWKEGDRIEVISKGFDGRDIGEMLTVDGLDNDDANQPVGVMGDDKTHSWPIVSRGHFLCIKWHSRPSA